MGDESHVHRDLGLGSLATSEHIMVLGMSERVSRNLPGHSVVVVTGERRSTCVRPIEETPPVLGDESPYIHRS